MRYLLNSWYVAAFADELPPGGRLGRTLLGENIVLFRTEQGAVAALKGLCPHRFAPLAAGKVTGNAIECPYHGLRFGTDGACVHNPHGDGQIPRSARTRYFPTAERDGLVWLWMGPPESADPDKITDYSMITSYPDTARISCHIPSAANYELMADNIMDLSHADFLHPGSLATWGEVTRLRPQVQERDKELQVAWDWSTSAAPPIFAPLLPAGGACDMRLQVNWRPAANMMIRFSCRPTGAAEPFEVRGCHLMTPENETSTHYFFVGTRTYLLENTEYTRIQKEQILYAFSQEDKPIIEAVQRGMQTTDLASLNPVLLPADAGAVRVRRKLVALIEAQAAR